ncbi:MAG TPA: PLP-dependent aminotransferase family protein [Gaiellaceae bacterium]|nr:PLP-dependent aminotransferase family protein [Gaiellaceae bacterium]
MDQSTRRNRAPEVLVELDRGAREPLSFQLERALRDGVRSGSLRPGTSLPSTRALATELGISRGLAVAAYAQLGAEGYLRLRRNAPPVVASGVGTAPETRTLAADPEWPHNLRPDLPDYGSFPRGEWLKSYRAALRSAPNAALAYGDVRGSAELRDALVAYLGRVRGVVGEPEHTFVCAGFAQAVSLLGGVLQRAGRRRIAVEDPSHVVVRQLVARSGLQPIPIPVDPEGIDVDALIAAAPDAVLVTPAHQFPTGVVLGPDRRARILAWAEETDALVIEDDFDSEYRYDRPPVGSLQGLMPERVVYCGTASKTLAPTLRLGWIVAPGELVQPLVDQVLFTIISPPRLEQLAFTDFLLRGELDRHLRRMRLRYRSRRDVLVQELAGQLPTLEVRGHAAGLYVEAGLPSGMDEARVVEEARARGVGLSGMAEHRAEAVREPALLLGYAVAPEPSLRRAVTVLAEAVRAAS